MLSPIGKSLKPLAENAVSHPLHGIAQKSIVRNRKLLMVNKGTLSLFLAPYTAIYSRFINEPESWFLYNYNREKEYKYLL